MRGRYSRMPRLLPCPFPLSTNVQAPLLYVKPVQTGFPADSDARTVVGSAACSLYCVSLRVVRHGGARMELAAAHFLAVPACGVLRLGQQERPSPR
eukprot:349715-Chlamydomonas_euryale.AAC.1